MLKNWITLKSEEVFKSITFKYHRVRRKSPTRDVEGDFDVIECYNSSSIIALTDKNEVVMVRQYRHGQDKLTLELPGGVVPKGEDFADAALRELEEETGFVSDSCSFLAKFDCNPAILTNEAQIFVAKDCKPIGKQQLDPFEEVEIVLVPISEIPEKIKKGEISHSLMISAFYFYFSCN